VRGDTIYGVDGDIGCSFLTFDIIQSEVVVAFEVDNMACDVIQDTMSYYDG
jgi:hypothetical protein